ncbi:hypothetical protein LRP88_13307 [Fusarium phalaenopsidis]
MTEYSDANLDPSGVCLRPSFDSRRSSVVSIMQIDQIISDDRINMETYGVSEMRDGFFDALFLTPEPLTPEEIEDKAILPKEFEKSHPLSPKAFFPRQLHELRSVARKVTTTRSGIRLLKSFLAFFLAYILCLVPTVSNWLGRYDYIMAISVILNQPARTFGSQVDGAILTIVGTACGLAWGIIGLLLSTSTLTAKVGYGGILTLFLALFMASIAYIRTFFIRFYQAVLCAGIAVTFTTLAETSSLDIKWPKFRSYAIPWLLGQAIAMAVNCLIFPDAGNRPLAAALDKSFRTMQGVVRALLSMDTDTDLFEDWTTPEIIVGGPDSDDESIDAGRKVARTLSGPTREVLACMSESMQRSHAALMDLSGWRKHFGPPQDVSSDLIPIQARFNNALVAFDAAESSLLASDTTESYDSQAVELFVFARHVREAAATIVNLMNKVHEMHLHSNRKRLNLPTYPPWKAIYRTNAQVRHDRGGVTAGMYQATFAEIAQLLESVKVGKEHRQSYEAVTGPEEPSIRGQPASRRDKLGYRIWTVLHRLQGFESRYALKVAVLTSALALPAWLSNGSWWNRFEAWWAVCMGWIMIHPRVGGNVQDLFTRAFAAILGAAWSGAAHAAGNGNPYVIAVFAAIYMIPMIDPVLSDVSRLRSFLSACETIQAYHQQHSKEYTKVWCFLSEQPLLLWSIGASGHSSLDMNSDLLSHVVANYVYFDEGKDPTPEVITRSEMLESRMREGFVRIRQLLVMTRHELRLRAPFDPIPYSCLAASCERFFEYLIAVRQSALFYNPNYIRDNPVAAEKLLSYRRDAVAAILGNLYILAGALKSQRKVPRYLPSAAAARKKLLHKSAEVAREMAESPEYRELERQKTWSDIYSYSYNESLTGCVAQLEELERFTKLIVGEKNAWNADLVET